MSSYAANAQPASQASPCPCSPATHCLHAPPACKATASHIYTTAPPGVMLRSRQASAQHKSPDALLRLGAPMPCALALPLPTPCTARRRHPPPRPARPPTAAAPSRCRHRLHRCGTVSARLLAYRYLLYCGWYMLCRAASYRLCGLGSAVAKPPSYAFCATALATAADTSRICGRQHVARRLKRAVRNGRNDARVVRASRRTTRYGSFTESGEALRLVLLQ